MNKERYNQIIDEAYENYLKGGHIKWLNQVEVDTPIGKINIPIPHTKEEFINKCKTDSEFSEKWGLKIEERELSLKERYDLVETDKHIQFVKCQSLGTDRIKEVLDEKNIPTKLITITYSDIKIESYE
jgi:hypothetical protein